MCDMFPIITQEKFYASKTEGKYTKYQEWMILQWGSDCSFSLFPKMSAINTLLPYYLNHVHF